MCCYFTLSCEAVKEIKDPVKEIGTTTPDGKTRGSSVRVRRAMVKGGGEHLACMFCSLNLSIDSVT